MKQGFVDIEISKLIKADWNYKEENEKLTEKLLENMKRNGQIENILIRELDTGFYEVVNGNHRLDVMKILKLKKVHAYNFGKIKLPQAQRIALETNETKFESDSIKMAQLITSLTKEFPADDLVETMPYTMDEIINMGELVDFNFDEFENKEEVDTFGDKDFTQEIKLKVSHETYKRWEELQSKMEDVLGYKNESKVFEFAVIEALNIPNECIGQ